MLFENDNSRVSCFLSWIMCLDLHTGDKPTISNNTVLCETFDTQSGSLFSCKYMSLDFVRKGFHDVETQVVIVFKFE